MTKLCVKLQVSYKSQTTRKKTVQKQLISRYHMWQHQFSSFVKRRVYFCYMFFHGKARMEKEILERMNEKRNHLHSFALFSGLFHNFVASFTQKERKYTLQQLKHS